ncbi:MAG: hypothetical protein M5U34_27305 [Chloroflexi bacterium]|nr:hypothetical protein [Chloroflexota bacterium]
MVIFTEHRDTFCAIYKNGSSPLFGRDEHIVHIDGGLKREDRRVVEDRFRNDPDVHFLVATDAAGEGHQPATRPFDDHTMTCSWNPRPAGAAFRPHPSNRPDRSAPPAESGGGRNP